MPTTINGIGTHYYGKRNHVRFMGQCHSCKRVGQLESYETREFFVIIFIPIIPLTKYQILDSCPICRRHRRLKLEEWNAQRTQLVAAAKASADAAPDNWDAQEGYAATLWNLCLIQEAIAAWQSLIAREPRRGSLHLGLARTLNSAGRHDEALAAYQQLATLDPSHDVGLVEYSNLLALRRRKDEALDVLKRHEPQNADSIHFLAALGDRAFGFKDFETASRVYARLVQLAPQFSENKRFMKTLKKAHKKAGIPYYGP